jgi:hypothetical protein
MGDLDADVSMKLGMDMDVSKDKVNVIWKDMAAE